MPILEHLSLSTIIHKLQHVSRQFLPAFPKPRPTMHAAPLTGLYINKQSLMASIKIQMSKDLECQRYTFSSASRKLTPVERIKSTEKGGFGRCPSSGSSETGGHQRTISGIMCENGARLFTVSYLVCVVVCYEYILFYAERPVVVTGFVGLAMMFRRKLVCTRIMTRGDYFAQFVDLRQSVSQREGSFNKRFTMMGR